MKRKQTPSYSAKRIAKLGDEESIWGRANAFVRGTSKYAAEDEPTIRLFSFLVKADQIPAELYGIFGPPSSL